MALVEINWHPPRQHLRVFAGLLLLFGAAVGGLLYFKYEQTMAGGVLLIVTAALGLIGFVWPYAIRPVYVVWMALAFPIGWVVSHVMLATVYYLVITPIGLVMRLGGRDPMQRRFDRTAATYWTRRISTRDLRRYFRQF